MIKRCFADLLSSEQGHQRMKAMVPSYDQDLRDPALADRQRELSEQELASVVRAAA